MLSSMNTERQFMTETHRPDPEQLARYIRDRLNERDRLQNGLIARLAPFEEFGWTIYPGGSNTSACMQLSGPNEAFDACVYPGEDSFELVFYGTTHSFVCTDADETIEFVESVKRALDGHKTDPSLFSELPEYDTTSLRMIPPLRESETSDRQQD